MMKKRERIQDITYYPINPGKTMKLDNGDNIPYQIEIVSENNVIIKKYKINLKDTCSFSQLNLIKLVNIHFNLLNITV